MYHHPNWSYSINIVAYSTLAALLNDGYSVAAEEYSQSTSAQDGITSNWGAAMGMLNEKKLADYVRAAFPAHTQMYHYGLSMGCLNSLTYEWMWPGSSAIACISGVTGLQQTWMQAPPYATTFSTVIDTA